LPPDPPASGPPDTSHVNFDSNLHPHRRFDPLSGEWVLVSPHRTQRPWQGHRESDVTQNRPAHDPKCYLCPGNQRSGGAVNPQYPGTFVFPNDYAALLPDVPLTGDAPCDLFRCEPVRGECRVICFSPRHDLTLPDMPVEDILRVVDVWAEQINELGAKYRWVQIFENKGAVMGCSNPHPHGQIWAGNFLPRFVTPEDRNQKQYLAKHDRPLLLDYAEAELKQPIRVIESNAHWLMVVPYWAVWPFELLLMPRRHVQRLPELTAEERRSLADILKRGLTRYDNLFETSFPYSMGWHGAPTDDGDYAHWQLHAHFYPPLLRSATVKKFMVGYEMLAEPQRDLTPEQAAKRLQETPAVHFKERSPA
jgi:UDPglucose--hexose-1-phosphate uridylyltransferase